MKHQVTVKVETKKHFLGIPYRTTEKKHLVVDGKTYWKMQKDLRAAEKDAARRRQKRLDFFEEVILEEEEEPDEWIDEFWEK